MGCVLSALMHDETFQCKFKPSGPLKNFSTQSGINLNLLTIQTWYYCLPASLVRLCLPASLTYPASLTRFPSITRLPSLTRLPFAGLPLLTGIRLRASLTGIRLPDIACRASLTRLKKFLISNQ